MTRLFKNITITAALLAAGFAMTACGDEEKDENKTPDIFSKIVSPLYDDLKADTDCGTILSKSNDFSTKHSGELSTACADYLNSLKTVADGKPGKLSESPENAGYYLSAYLIVNKLHDNAISCTANAVNQDQAKNAFESIFANVPGCESFLSDAKTISDARGSR